MKKKEKVNIIISSILLLMSFIVLVLPSFKVLDIKLVMIIIYSCYTILKLLDFIINRKELDYESLFTSIISFIALLGTIFLKLNTKNIVLILMIWLGVMSLIKLKKADFYHDKKSNMWILRLFILNVFIITGIITAINLLHDSDVQILIIGYFFLINNILDIVDPIVNYLKEV